MATATRLPPRRVGRRQRPWLSIAIGVVVAAIVLLMTCSGIWLEIQWFQSVGQMPVFLTRVEATAVLWLIGALVAALFVFVNLRLAMRALRVPAPTQAGRLPYSILVLVVCAVAALLFGGAAADNWESALKLLNQTPFGLADPVFHQDVGFYVFAMPVLEALQGWLLGLVGLTLLVSAAAYAISIAAEGADRAWTSFGQDRGYGSTVSIDLASIRQGFSAFGPMLRHASVLVALAFVLFAFGAWLSIYDLAYSGRGVVFGASRADLTVEYPVDYVLMGLDVLLALWLLLNALRRPRVLPLVAAPVAGVLVAIVLAGILPSLYEQLFVRPNQLAMERPFIENNIAMTRQAYNLEGIQVADLSGDGVLRPEDVQANQNVISDIRISDYRPLLDAYNQIQRIRQYYAFREVDIDRYPLQGGESQVMLSARELEVGALPQVARTWQNTHLVYTHGQGVAMNLANRVTAQGLPDLIVHDIPPATDEPALQVPRPQIYFGQDTSVYAIVNSGEDEFDRPGGPGEPSEVHSRYEGDNGVPIGGGLRRLAVAAGLGDLNVLLSSSLTDGSQVLLHRQVQERIQQIAPFLRLDSDPYMVIADGRQVWLQDAYTTTDRFPHATRAGDFNYIRNSVKIAVDAYTGDMRLYVVDPQEPILQTYARIYPSIFVPVDQAPASLRAHFRFPEDLFNTQAAMFSTYHMTDPQTFYNREDLWSIAQETYAGRLQQMQAYYVMQQLPGETNKEFTMILPFTPGGANRTNMVAWMVARSDGDNYGQRLVYRFPQGRLVFGPQQIEARINQEPSISSQITLWSQQGSQVIRGNLLVIPLESALLYIQPLYLQASQNPLPELKRIIAASTEGVVMSDRLDTALTALAQGRRGEVLSPGATAEVTAPSPPGAAQPGAPQPNASPTAATSTATNANLAKQALDHYHAAQDALKRNDWAEYGRQLGQMEDLLNQLSQR